MSERDTRTSDAATAAPSATDSTSVAAATTADVPKDATNGLADTTMAKLELPPPRPAFTVSDAAGLALALVLHSTVLTSLLAPERRLGVGGREPDAIGVDLVVLDAALNGRIGTSTRGAAGTSAGIDRAPSATAPAPDQQAAPDLMQATTNVTPSPLLPPGAGRTVQGPAPQPDDLDNNAPTSTATNALPASTMSPDPSIAVQTGKIIPSPSLQTSEAAEASLNATTGPISASGDAINATTAALALSRAGRRDRYGATVFAALRDNLPVPIPGTTAKVTIEFIIKPDGQSDGTRVTTSSGIDAVDAAALAAVRSTTFPVPPSDIEPRDLVYTMEYTFTDDPKQNSATIPPSK